MVFEELTCQDLRGGPSSHVRRGRLLRCKKQHVTKLKDSETNTFRHLLRGAWRSLKVEPRDLTTLPKNVSVAEVCNVRTQTYFKPLCIALSDLCSLQRGHPIGPTLHLLWLAIVAVQRWGHSASYMSMLSPPHNTLPSSWTSIDALRLMSSSVLLPKSKSLVYVLNRLAVTSESEAFAIRMAST